MKPSLNQFAQMIPSNRNPESWYGIALDLFAKYNINTVERVSSFMAQCAHESNDFRNLEENMNYSEKNLLRVFPRYFGKGKRNPAEYARNPEKLANYVYMDQYRTKRGALGNIHPGDGWRFRGGGIKQLTGRNNYTEFATDIGMSPEDAADYVRTKRGAFESACWFWAKNKLERYADRGDIVGMSKKVNGGTIGLDSRIRRYEDAKAILSGIINSNTIRRRSRGPLVQKVQNKLGLYADGIFGVQTEVAVRSWQRANGFNPDGVLDGQQLEKLLN